MAELTMDKLVSYCKTYGFIFPGSEIYGGLANAWDYGPLGVELKNNIKNAWWKKFVSENEHNVGLDSCILMNPKTWEASGHLGGFSDPLMDCKSCRSRHRADTLIEEYVKKHNLDIDFAEMATDNSKMEKFILDNKIKCPVCGKDDFTPIRKFNLMFKTFMGVTEDSVNTIYLRPETAQGIFVNFKNVLRTTRSKMPLGIGQIGKSFRNEITPGNFIFRTREFEQMELEFFCKPGTDLEWFNYWRTFCKDWLISLGINEDKLRLRDHGTDELCFYSKATTDFEFKFPFGWGELWGVADRTDYDLTQHAKVSGSSMEYLDPVTNEKYIPYVIEPSLGVDRMFLATLCNAYEEESLEKDDTRIIMHFKPFLAPIKVAILPLVKKDLSEKARKIFTTLSKKFRVIYDDSGSIGKRYRRQDAVGTPFCITIDYDTLNDDTVTLRDRDTMEQRRMSVNEVVEFVNEKIEF